MKVGILTWHKTINHGAVLQAYATQGFLESNGCDAVLLDYQRHVESLDDVFTKKLARRASKLTPSRIRTVAESRRWNQEKAKAFADFREGHIKQGKPYWIDQGLDLAVIGSDMIFDFYEGYNSFSYGIGVEAPRKISYAASFGYTTHQLLDSSGHKEEIRDGLRRLESIGCRDENTISLVEELVPNCCPSKNIDPVLLYGFQSEAAGWGNPDILPGRPYLLVYSYTFNMDSRAEIAAIRRLANELGCLVVSVGYWHHWCDLNINAGPEDFVNLFANAAYVVTDTFHGTVFALNFKKQFRAVIRRNSFKVRDLLRDLRAEGCIANSPDEIARAGEAPVDYGPIDERLAAMRRESAQYLLSHVGRDR